MECKIFRRKDTRQINIGKVKIGGGAPISVQSMTKTDTWNIKATVEQIHRLEEAGCELIRVAVPDEKSAKVLRDIKREITIPLIADIHFDYRLALLSIEQGIDALRINPGNIGARERIKNVVAMAKDRGIPIRIGVNAGSIEKELLEKYCENPADAMVKSAMRHVKILEEMDFHDIKISLKASDVLTTIDAYRIISKRVDYPLHLGITEAGGFRSGAVKSAIGIGILLTEGIGDTIRVSLTGDPVEEVMVAYDILKSLKIRQRGINIISCPTCGRIKIDIAGITAEIERRLSHITQPLSIAVMGCVVNGPGEAKDADLGIAGGDGSAMLFVKGKMVKKINENEIVNTIYEEVNKLVCTFQK